MEREPVKNFSIEPYIEQGGILGNEITVNQKAAGSIMKRTALRRDFNVSKGYFRDKYETEGSEELAISTIRVQNLNHKEEISASGFSTLTKDLGNWKLLVHDQQIADDVDGWMQKNFKSEGNNNGQQVFKERYVKEFRKEVINELTDAFLSEKGNIFAASTTNSLLKISVAGTIGWFLFATSEYFKADHFTSYQAFGSFMIKYWSGGIPGVFAIYIFEKLSNNIENSKLRPIENYLPNPQIPSIVCGSASLLLNSNKLIKLNND